MKREAAFLRHLNCETALPSVLNVIRTHPLTTLTLGLAVIASLMTDPYVLLDKILLVVI